MSEEVGYSGKASWKKWHLSGNPKAEEELGGEGPEERPRHMAPSVRRARVEAGKTRRVTGRGRGPQLARAGAAF